MTNFWISWFHKEAMGAFELHSPWWVSGARVSADRLAFHEEREEPTICAAVSAPDEEAAKEMIAASYDTLPGTIEWRFCEARPDDWSPFSGRFRKADWMKWPAPAMSGKDGSAAS